MKFVCKLLNVHSPWTLKFGEITALVPFRQPRLLSTIIKRSAVKASFPEVKNFLTVDYVRRKLFWPVEGFSSGGI